jgi:hypothetical protein
MRHCSFGLSLNRERILKPPQYYFAVNHCKLQAKTRFEATSLPLLQLFLSLRPRAVLFIFLFAEDHPLPAQRLAQYAPPGLRS